jgi:hypothetical protein
MTLLDCYVRSVGMFLPKGSPREDILAEISEHLVSTMEEKEARLGRPLTEREQERVLNDYGSPMIVAGRYGRSGRSLSFGGALIGPEIFPLYLRVLILNWGISVAIHLLLVFVIGKPFGLRIFLTAVTMQFVGITVTFVIIDRLQRRSEQKWYYPPVYLAPIPRWQSVSGLIAWTVVIGWWAAIPLAPFLILGAAANDLVLTTGWYVVYWPVFVLILAGIVQRAINLARPDLNWLPPAVRLVTGVVGLALLFVMFDNPPYVTVADPANASSRVVQLSAGLNGLIRWAVIGIAPFYLLFNVGLNAWFSAQHIGYALRRRQVRTS